ncbi:transposase family protein [Verrucomicrobia bacterium]|nr:transposase family protein [Verrucomicrobiota bacterium]
MGGSFVWTLTSVDIASGWTDVRAVWNRGQYTTCEGLEDIKDSQPFDLKGVDSDNGAEFLNHHLYDWLKKQDIQQTRSRPYHKNDQAHVEQKNYSHVRLLLGDDRLEHPEVIPTINKLLKIWCLWRNLYCVTMEQTSKRREGSKQILTHAKTNRTPAQRLLDGSSLTSTQREWLKSEQGSHNPFAMKRQIGNLLKRVWRENGQLARASLAGKAVSERSGGTALPANRNQSRKQGAMVSCK